MVNEVVAMQKDENLLIVCNLKVCNKHRVTKQKGDPLYANRVPNDAYLLQSFSRSNLKTFLSPKRFQKMLSILKLIVAGSKQKLGRINLNNNYLYNADYANAMLCDPLVWRAIIISF